MLRRGWNEPEWQEKTNAILKNPSLQGIAWEFIPGAHPLVARFLSLHTHSCDFERCYRSDAVSLITGVL
jgi:hypothetical protein